MTAAIVVALVAIGGFAVVHFMRPVVIITETVEDLGAKKGDDLVNGLAVLLTDEPSGNLDKKTTKPFQSLASSGQTILMGHARHHVGQSRGANGVHGRRPDQSDESL